MVPAPDLVEPIADRREKVGVRVEDRPVRRERDYRLRPVKRRDLPIEVEGAQGPRLDPDLQAALRDAAERADLRFSPAQRVPERPVFGRVAFVGIDEHAMMAPDDFVARVAHDAEEVGVGGQDRSVGGEFNDGLRPLQRRHRIRAADIFQYCGKHAYSRAALSSRGNGDKMSGSYGGVLPATIVGELAPCG